MNEWADASRWVHVYRGRKRHLRAEGTYGRTVCGKSWIGYWIEGDPRTEAAPECADCVGRASDTAERGD